MKYNPELPHYVGGVNPNCDYTHGQIPPARGVKCYQVSRASRDASADDGTGFTYKHAADIAFWNGKFYIQYLCNPKDEHTGTGVDVLASSEDAVHWERRISFPPYRIPSCTVTDCYGEAHTFSGKTDAFIHHRVCFYHTSDDRLLLLSFYGWSPKPWICNWDNYGIGRVVRELYKNGEMGDIYFIRPCYQGGWTDELLNYPLYDKCPDEGFVRACDELLSNPLAVQQWAEENGDRDELIQIKHPEKGGKNEAFCWYHIDERTVIGLWKHSRAAKSADGGKTWSEAARCPSLVMSGQKVWAQRTSDGRFAMVYDPTMETQHRYPMCVTTSSDGLEFDNMLLVHGEVPPMRYEGFWKDLGPQYMRGIAEGIDRPSDGAVWMAYSVNKEDIWIAKIPVPIIGGESASFDESFSRAETLENWNLYCPSWTSARIENQTLVISDAEPYDYCKIERILPTAKRLRLEFSITPRGGEKPLYIEVCNEKAQVAARLIFRADGKLYARTVAEIPIAEYALGIKCKISLLIDCDELRYTVSINGTPVRGADGEPAEQKFMAAVNDISRFILRTGAVRTEPTLDYIPDNKPVSPLDGCETPLTETVYELDGLKAERA